MAEERTLTMPKGQWAENAETAIPFPPETGAPYRNPDVNLAEWKAGQPFEAIVNSAKWNHLFYLLTGLLSAIEQTGILAWSPFTNYKTGAIAMGTDNILYRAIAQSGPDNGGAFAPPNITRWGKLIPDIPNATPATATVNGQAGIVRLAASNNTTSLEMAATPAGAAAQITARTASAATASVSGSQAGIVRLAADNAADTVRDEAATPALVAAKVAAVGAGIYLYVNPLLIGTYSNSGTRTFNLPVIPAGKSARYYIIGYNMTSFSGESAQRIAIGDGTICYREVHNLQWGDWSSEFAATCIVSGSGTTQGSVYLGVGRSTSFYCLGVIAS